MAIKLISGKMESGEVGSNSTQTYKLVFEIDANQNAESRQYSLHVDGCGGKSKDIKISQEGKNIVIRDFDYLILSYDWGTCNGEDFDSATAIMNSGSSLIDSVFLGYKFPAKTNNVIFIDKNGEHKQNGPDYQSWYNGIGFDNMYLVWGGDNMESGAEVILINIKKIREEIGFDLPSELIISVKGNWHNQKASGKDGGAVKVNLVAYKGGTPVRERIGSTKIKIDNPQEVRYNNYVLVDIASQERGSELVWDYSWYDPVATIKYRKADNSAEIVAPRETKTKVIRDCDEA